MCEKETSKKGCVVGRGQSNAQAHHEKSARHQNFQTITPVGCAHTTENGTPSGSDASLGDFIPLADAWEHYSAQKFVDICDLCQRIRSFRVEPDDVCREMTERGFCLAIFYKNAKHLD